MPVVFECRRTDRCGQGLRQFGRGFPYRGDRACYRRLGCFGVLRRGVRLAVRASPTRRVLPMLLQWTDSAPAWRQRVTHSRPALLAAAACGGSRFAFLKAIPVDVSPDTFSRERLAENCQKLRRPVYPRDFAQRIWGSTRPMGHRPSARRIRVTMPPCRPKISRISSSVSSKSKMSRFSCLC